MIARRRQAVESIQRDCYDNPGVIANFRNYNHFRNAREPGTGLPRIVLLKIAPMSIRCLS